LRTAVYPYTLLLLFTRPAHVSAVYLRSDGDHEDKLVQLFGGLGGRAGERERGESMSPTVSVVAKTVYKKSRDTERLSPRSRVRDQDFGRMVSRPI